MTGETDRPERIVDGGGLWQGRLLQFTRLESTNRWVLSHLDFCRHGDVVWAQCQTAGRGRFDRPWLSPGGRGLTLSFVFTELDEQFFPTLGHTAALAVRDTLEHFSINAQLKWPNDVLIKGNKIAGILSEVDFNRHTVVLGIGLNVNFDRRDIESGGINVPVTSMRIVKNRQVDIGEVRLCLVRKMENYCDLIVEKGTSIIVEAWRQSDWLTGRRIRITNPNFSVEGRYAGMDHNGQLRLVDDQETENRFLAGDVTRLELCSSPAHEKDG